MQLIPVIDLMAGRAVHARPGGRARYAPLATTLCPDGDPLALARRFAGEFGATRLYIADLDAIEAGGERGGEGCGDNLDTIRAIAASLPGLQLWVDAGLRDAVSVSKFEQDCPGRPVIGSETLNDCAVLTTPSARHALLSLDFRDHTLLGPPDLGDRPELWPRDLIVMSLSHVGAERGPDLERLEKLRGLAPAARLYAAGGVRNESDLKQLAAAGAAGVLLASALHQGRITPDVTRLFD